MNKNLFVVLEGLDGSGKTTICEELANELGWELYRTPPDPFKKIRSDIDKNANPETRFYFYLASVLYASKEIKEILKTNSVICDRYIYSTICYHLALEPRLSYFDISQLDLLKPDFVIYLEASYEERVRRIANRGNKRPEEIMNDMYNSKNFQFDVEKEYHKFKDIIKINTENCTVNEVVNQIKEIIKNKK
jgi:dTMP kinase